jgi:hypothetical protein
MPFAVYLDKYFIDVEGVTVATVLSFQAPGIDSNKFDAPEAENRKAMLLSGLQEKAGKSLFPLLEAPWV